MLLFRKFARARVPFPRSGASARRFRGRAGWRDDLRGVFGRRGEVDHIAGQPPHRREHHHVERDHGEQRDDQRDQQRQQNDVERIGPHGRLQRRLAARPRHIPRPSARAPRTSRMRPSGASSVRKAAAIDPQAEKSRRSVVSSTSGGMSETASMRRLVGRFSTIMRAPTLSRIDGLQVRRNHAFGRGVENERGGVGGRQARLQPVVAEVGDRRNVDRDFREQHEADDQHEHAARQPEARQARARSRPLRAVVELRRLRHPLTRTGAGSSCALHPARARSGPHRCRAPARREISDRVRVGRDNAGHVLRRQAFWRSASDHGADQFAAERPTIPQPRMRRRRAMIALRCPSVAPSVSRGRCRRSRAQHADPACFFRASLPTGRPRRFPDRCRYARGMVRASARVRSPEQNLPQARFPHDARPPCVDRAFPRRRRPRRRGGSWCAVRADLQAFRRRRRRTCRSSPRLCTFGRRPVAISRCETVDEMLKNRRAGERDAMLRVWLPTRRTCAFSAQVDALRGATRSSATFASSGPRAREALRLEARRPRCRAAGTPGRQVRSAAADNDQRCGRTRCRRSSRW